jgi:hypothetical protein
MEMTIRGEQLPDRLCFVFQFLLGIGASTLGGEFEQSSDVLVLPSYFVRRRFRELFAALLFRLPSSCGQLEPEGGAFVVGAVFRWLLMRISPVATELLFAGIFIRLPSSIRENAAPESSKSVPRCHLGIAAVIANGSGKGSWEQRVEVSVAGILRPSTSLLLMRTEEDFFVGTIWHPWVARHKAVYPSSRQGIGIEYRAGPSNSKPGLNIGIFVMKWRSR